jgi:hypothetical protein
LAPVPETSLAETGWGLGAEVDKDLQDKKNPSETKQKQEQKDK